jgi:hypothetical protein
MSGLQKYGTRIEESEKNRILQKKKQSNQALKSIPVASSVNM